MDEDNQEKEAKEPTEEEKYQKFVDSWLFPDHKENTEEERKAHELMDIWYKEWLKSRKKEWIDGELRRATNISAPEGEEALLEAWNRRRQEHPQPVVDQGQREYLEQQERERAQHAAEVQRKLQAESMFRHSQIPLMNKDQIGLKFVELQVTALKYFVQYVKDIQYCLPLHMSIKPFIDIAKHLQKTIAFIGITKSMDETWVTKYGKEVASIQDQLKWIDGIVKKRRKQMMYI